MLGSSSWFFCFQYFSSPRCCPVAGAASSAGTRGGGVGVMMRLGATLIGRPRSPRRKTGKFSQPRRPHTPPSRRRCSPRRGKAMPRCSSGHGKRGVQEPPPSPRCKQRPPPVVVVVVVSDAGRFIGSFQIQGRSESQRISLVLAGRNRCHGTYT